MKNIIKRTIDNLSKYTQIINNLDLEKKINSDIKILESLEPLLFSDKQISTGIALLVYSAHKNARDAGWLTDLNTGETKKRNKGELLMLIVSEIAEAMEGERKNLMDDHLPERRMAEVELADAVIRIADYCGEHQYDLAGAILEKMKYNKLRQDHKIENRKLDGGKSF